MKMRICVGKSANPERVLPSMAMETVGETVLPAAVEAVGMAETIDEKAVSGKSGRKKPENMLEALQCFLTARYDFRYNLLTEQTEYRGKEMLEEWHVREECFTYDLNGLGQIFKGFFPNAIPFNNKEAVEEKFKYIYANLKSQAAYLFAQKIINREISIEPTLLERKFSGKGFEKVPLRQILDKERKAIRKDEDSEEKGWTIIKKIIMKKLVGHSPDFIEALLMRMIFEIKHKRKHIKGLGLI